MVAHWLYTRRSLLLSILCIVLATAALLSFALYNGFPLLYPDSGTYFESGYNGYVPRDRFWTYGLFIWLVCQDWNLWFAVFWPALLLSALLFRCCTVLLGSTRWIFLGAVMLLVILTGVSLPVGQLIPDVFAPILICALVLLFLDEGSFIFRTLYAGSIILAMSMHMSHILLGVVIVGGWILFQFKSFSLKGISLYSLILLSGILISPTLHWAKSGNFSMVEKGYFFHLNRLVDNGALNEYLKRSCGDSDELLCGFKNQLTQDFLWDVQKSPLYLLGGWDDHEDYYRQIVREVHFDPYYLRNFILPHFWKNGWRQLVNFGVFDVHPIQGERFNNMVLRHLPHQHDSVKSGHQESDKDKVYDYAKMLDRMQEIFIPLSLLLTLLLWSKMQPQFRTVFCIIAFALLANAFITGGLSTVVPRYQNRVMWLSSLPIVVQILNRLMILGQNFKPLSRK